MLKFQHTQDAEWRFVSKPLTGRLRGLRPFKPGETGNPSGRPKSWLKGCAEEIAQQTKDGKDLVEFHVKVFKGDRVNGYQPKLKDSQKSADWLADRLWGRVPNQPGEEDQAPRNQIQLLAILQMLPSDALAHVLEAARKVEQLKLAETTDAEVVEK